MKRFGGNGIGEIIPPYPCPIMSYNLMIEPFKLNSFPIGGAVYGVMKSLFLYGSKGFFSYYHIGNLILLNILKRNEQIIKKWGKSFANEKENRVLQNLCFSII